MSDLLSFREKESEEEKIAAILETFGPCFDDVYKDGKYDGKHEAKLEVVSNLLAMGLDEDIILEGTGISISELNKIKRDLYNIQKSNHIIQQLLINVKCIILK